MSGPPRSQVDAIRSARSVTLAEALFRVVVVLFGLGLGFGLPLVALVGTVLVDNYANRRELYVSTSHDGAQRLVVTMRREWFGRLVDPRVELRVDLEVVASGERVDQLILGVERRSDVGMPSASWNDQSVALTGIERRHEVQATLRRTKGPEDW